jgi:hypothetical protein
MLKIKYTIKQINPNIFVIIVPDSYTRAMLFLRIQEFYESKNKKFRSKKFSFWEYMAWYSSINKNKFTYPYDWGGFNVPLKVAMECQKINKIETPYDKQINKIIKEISKKNIKLGYIIGVESTKSRTFLHEISHALYYTNKQYKKEMNKITKSLNKKLFMKLKNKLKKMGYCNKVILDELQAYLSTDDTLVKNKIISKKIKLYKEVFKKYFV